MTSNRSQNIGLMQDLGHILHNTIKFQLNLFHTWYNASRAWRKGQVIWNHGMSVFILQLNQTKAHMTIKWSLVWSRSLNYAGLHFSQNALLSIQRTLLTLPTYWLEREPRIMLLYVNSPWHYVLHRVRKKRPPKHVQITLWIENDSHYYHWIVLYTVHFAAFCLGGGGVFSGHGVHEMNVNRSQRYHEALALFVLVSCARLSWSHSAFELTLNSCIVSYRIMPHFEFTKKCIITKH